eukprot:15361050-Ditylum_brightwellii.AAC.1
MASTLAFSPNIALTVSVRNVARTRPTVHATKPLRNVEQSNSSPFFFATTIPDTSTIVAKTTIDEPKATKPLRKEIKKKGPAHPDGIFSPAVRLAKKAMGEDRLIKFRAKVIALHSDTIKSFVDTADTKFGQGALFTMFQLADKDKNGTLDTNEVAEGLNKLGFSWMKEKQISGIMKRADKDDNGVIDYEEFVDEAPKTLKTNLVKLAKKNGGDLGFLS